MKIAILGSRGIPNNYGGFEQFAEYLSKRLASRGHEVWVCNPHYHSFTEGELEGVHIRHVFNPENIMGTAGNFIYDFLSLKYAGELKPDIILMLGYTTSSVWFRFFEFRSRNLVTNLDGLEWKRDKWSPAIKRLTRWFEKLAVRYGGYLIADHTEIQDYFLHQYQVPATYIPYGADVFENPDEAALEEFRLEKNSYCLMIARFEAEHNMELIIEGYLGSDRPEKLVLVGNHGTPYGLRLYRKYRHQTRLHFTGGIYDMVKLNNLRYFSSYYFHGHSIGGTNPSLLEAMAARALIIAHENPFNRAILGSDAFYFTTSGDIIRILKTLDTRTDNKQSWRSNNVEKINTRFNWDHITSSYENLFAAIVEGRQQQRTPQPH